jgi:hypothetical protein
MRNDLGRALLKNPDYPPGISSREIAELGESLVRNIDADEWSEDEWDAREELDLRERN